MCRVVFFSLHDGAKFSLVCLKANRGVNAVRLWSYHKRLSVVTQLVGYVTVNGYPGKKLYNNTEKEFKVPQSINCRAGTTAQRAVFAMDFRPCVYYDCYDHWPAAGQTICAHGKRARIVCEDFNVPRFAPGCFSFFPTKRAKFLFHKLKELQKYRAYFRGILD